MVRTRPPYPCRCVGLSVCSRVCVGGSVRASARGMAQPSPPSRFRPQRTTPSRPLPLPLPPESLPRNGPNGPNGASGDTSWADRSDRAVLCSTITVGRSTSCCPPCHLLLSAVPPPPIRRSNHPARRPTGPARCSAFFCLLLRIRGGVPQWFRSGSSAAAAPRPPWRYGGRPNVVKIYICKSPFCWFLWLSGKSTPHRPVHVNFTWRLGIFFWLLWRYGAPSFRDPALWHVHLPLCLSARVRSGRIVPSAGIRMRCL